MIEFDDVTVRFGEKTLLANVTLSLAAGSFHFLTGPSGAGKTTVIRLCSLDMPPSQGRVTVLDAATDGLTRDASADLRQKIGVVDQDSRFIDHLSLADNVLMPMTVRDDAGVMARQHLDELLAWVGLGPLADRLPPELSGGERQRAALARALIRAPDLVLADEPTGNVDWEMSLRLLDLMIELNAMGKTVLCATHDLNLIRQAKSRVSARVLRIRSGGIDYAGADL